MLVRHLMCTEVFSLAPKTRILDAARSLTSRGLRRAPVIDASGALVGFVTAGDLREASPGSIGALSSTSGMAAANRSVGDICSRGVIVAQPDDHIEDLASVFLHKQIGGVPVVDHGRVVGVITESDIFRAVMDAAHLNNATRITVQRTQAPAGRSVQKVVQFLKLELVGLTQYYGGDGREVYVIKVRGNRVDDLHAELARAGWLILDRRDPSERKPSRAS